jgi:hypothetical protein
MALDNNKGKLDAKKKQIHVSRISWRYEVVYVYMFVNKQNHKNNDVMFMKDGGSIMNN